MKTHIRLGAAQLELADCDLCLLHTCGPTRPTNDVLLQYQTLNKLCVINRTSNLLDQADIAKIHVNLLFLGNDGR